MNELDQRAEEIFEAALKLPPKERAAYLDRVCGGEAQPRERIVEALFKAQESMAATAKAPPPRSPDKTVAISGLTDTAGEKVGDRIGRYKLLEKRGEGGMGTVWVAEQTEPVRRKVALKVIKLGMDTKQVIARFQAERQALALMDHPNIAKVLDAGATDTGRPYFVMEFVAGEPITNYCDRHNLSSRARLDLFVQVCKAIEHAHQKGIIHRDIKPSNIMVTLQDGVPVPKVIDFGIAKATGASFTEMTIHTALAEFIGTPAYMSPEQAEMTGVDIDPRSDIYSLGVMLYELLTGRTPFDAKRLIAAGLEGIRRIIREEEPPRPSTRLSTLDANEQTTIAKHRQSTPPKLIHLVRGDLDWIVMKCLEKDRTRRYETANGLAMDIKHLINNEPVVARPPSNLYRLQKLIRRNKLMFTAAGCVGAALVTGISISGWQASRYGNISITSQPSGALIWESDQMMGTTPYRANNIKAGKLHYRVQLEGYEPCPLALEVGKKVTTEWTAVLRKRGSPEPVGSQQSRSDIRIFELEGRAEFMRAGATVWVLATTNQLLHPGDQVRTGRNSRVQLLWPDRTLFRLGESTLLEVRGPGKDIKVTTPNASAAIRG